MRTCGRVRLHRALVRREGPAADYRCPALVRWLEFRRCLRCEETGAVEAVRILARGASISKLLAIGASEIGAFGRGAGSPKIAFLAISLGFDL
jgi:hypothetical protein